MRTVHVKLTVDLVLKVDEGVEVQEVVDELDYSFKDTTTKADVEDSTITDFEVTDSR